jgi:hypothetical protein
MKRLLTALSISFCFQIAGIDVLHAGDSRVFHCATSEDVYNALGAVEPGDTIMLEGGKVYEIEDSLELRASGSDGKRIKLTSEDREGLGRYAVITTVGDKKEADLVALRITGSFWTISRLEIAGTKVPLDEGYWDTNGFRLGLFLTGPGSHNNLVEDVQIHHTHNAAVAVRDESHHNTFRRLNIHHIGEWLDAGYNAHEAEGFYIGSSKGINEAGNRARVHDILIEESVLGPGLLGQYVDIKYAASSVTVRNNVFYCGEKSYNEEVVKLAGYGNLIEDNTFVGSSENLTRYIHLFNKKTDDPVRVTYRGKQDVPAPTGRDNTVINNVFYPDNPDIQIVRNDLADADRSSAQIENNTMESRK